MTSSPRVGDPRDPAGGIARAIERRAVRDRLATHPATPLVVVTAPAGYGKTTFMLNVARQSERSAYLRVTPRHDDPSILMHDLALAIGAIVPLPAGLIGRLSERSLEPGLQAASRLAEAIGDLEGHAVLLIDDIHLLEDRRSADAVTVFLELLPAGLRTFVAGHDASALRLGRARAAGQVLEIGKRDLAFEAADTSALATRLGVQLSDRDLATLTEQTGGWPVAISLALNSRASGEATIAPPAAIIDRSVADYIRTELLDPLDAERRTWLVRSSVLDVMSGPLCDEALQVSGSLRLLRGLERSSILIQPIDDAATEYRYHPLLRNLLRDQLDVDEPGEARPIAARAAGWFHAQGESIQALEYARLAEDRELVAKLMAVHAWPLHWAGRIATLEQWVQWFDRDGLRDRYASVAVVAGFMYAIDGRRHPAEMWLAAAEGSQDPGPMPDGSTTAAWVAILRGMLLMHGVDPLAKDARVAEDGMRGDSPFMPGVRLLSAVATWLDGDLDAAALRVREAAELAEARGALPGFAMATGIEASLALRSGNAQLARKRIEHGLTRLQDAGLTDYVLSSLVHAVAARVAMASGSVSQARDHLAHVHRLRPLQTAATPWLAVPIRLEAIEALVALRDVAAARTLMREVDDILRVRPQLGTLVDDAEAMRGRLEKMHQAGDGQWTLTAAELRVLQYLPTHLTFGEIAERLYVSPHTVKSQAVAIYGKLGVSSRRAAIETAVEFGLLDASALRFPLGPGVASGIG